MRQQGMRLFAVVALATCVVSTVSAPPARAAVPLGIPPIEQAPSGSGGDTEVGSSTSRQGEAGFETDRVSSPIAPGLELTEFDRFGPDGWIRGDVLTADLSQPGLVPEYLDPGAASATVPLSDQAARVGAVAGVNGDFFDINVTGAPLGVAVDSGELKQAPAGGHNSVASVGKSGVARLMEVFLDARVVRADGAVQPVSDLNTPTVSSNGIGLYTPFWGAASRTSAVAGAQRIREVEIRDGVVSAVRPAPVEGPVPTGAIRLLGRDGGADALASMRVGEAVQVDYRPRVDGETPRVAVGGNKVLVRDGRIAEVDGTALHPRTAAGFSADGRRMWLVTIDGRQADSRGMTERQLAEYLRSLGADDAINLDGGGSSTLLARERGESAAGVHNSPSDGHERLVPNGIGFSLAQGSGRLTGFRVEPAVRSADAERVLSGLSRRLSAFGHDETGDPVPSNPQWTVLGGGRVEPEPGQAVFHADRPGRVEVTAREGAVRESTGLDVLGPVARVYTDVERIPLRGQGDRGRFRVRGSDAGGFGTWIEPQDVALRYDPNLVRVSPDRDGFVLTALTTRGSGVVTATVGHHVTHLGVTVGSEPRQVSPLDGIAGWEASVYPASVRASLSEAEGRAGTPGLALDYALTGSTTTRAAYVRARPPVPLPEGTQKLGVWVHGDGKGGWLRYTVADQSGVASTVDLARKVDWTGWRYVEGALPAGLRGPVSLQRFYVVEPDAGRQYEGRLVFDDLTASVAPEVSVPQGPEPQDPAVVADGTLPPETGALRVAVLSDAQFTADDPDGPLVRQARRTLREAVAAKPDAIVINGDFVDRGTAADFDLARQVLDSEVGDRVPWYYVPGNHETYGPGDLSEFTAEFGPAHRVLDVRGTRIMLLDSSRGSLRAGGFDQITALRSGLERAASDPAVHSVAVFLHHPADDPAPGDASELSDPKEAELVADWLADFERRTGKHAVRVAAHAGTFHASTVDGVQELVNGNAGKSPSTAPDDGGFTGSSLLRIDPAQRDSPVRWETRPHVDEVRLPVPGELAAGASVPVRAQVRQGDRWVPIAYPVSADWSGSQELHVGPPGDAGPRKVAAFDPATGTLTGLRAGTVELRVTVNGVTRAASFTVV